MRLQEKVFALLKKIPRGRVASYKELARKLGTSPRAVARILASNKHPVIIPCHRVVHVSGEIGGYTPKGPKEKALLLKREGVKITRNKVREAYFYYFY